MALVSSRRIFTTRPAIQFLLVTSLGMVNTACNAGGSSKPSSKSSATSNKFVNTLADDTPILEYKGGKITAKDVNQFIAAQVKQMDQRLMEMYQQSAEQALVMKLVEEEAKKQGLTPQALVQKQSETATISDEVINKFIKDNKLEKGVKNPQTGKLEKVNKDELRSYLMDQEMNNARQKYLMGLLATAQPKQLFEEERTQVPEAAYSYFKGGANAKVVIHEFSDFDCPFCKNGSDILHEIAAAYGDKVKIYFRNFPIDSRHPRARPAAVAAACAGKQGKFWEMHDKLFANQTQFSDENLKKWAKEIGLADMAKWQGCYDKKETMSDIDSDMAVAEKVGVDATPTFIINGKKMPGGAQPFSKMKVVIDAELARSGG